MIKLSMVIEKIHPKAIIAALVFTLVCVLAIISVQCTGVDWTTWRQASSMPDNAFNETIHDGYLRQPWNTFSSLFYSLVGMYIICLPTSKKRAKNSIKIGENKTIKFIYGLSLIITGLGSSFLHMSLTFVGQTTDVIGMYLISTFIILYAVLRNRQATTKQFLALMALFNFVLLIPLIFSPFLRRNLFAALMVLGLILEYKLSKNNQGNRPRLLLACAGIMMFGFVFWLLDNARLFFDPNSCLQGHVIWHLCGAVAAGLLYHYYVKESTKRAERDGLLVF